MELVSYELQQWLLPEMLKLLKSHLTQVWLQPMPACSCTSNYISSSSSKQQDSVRDVWALRHAFTPTYTRTHMLSMSSSATPAAPPSSFPGFCFNLPVINAHTVRQSSCKHVPTTGVWSEQRSDDGQVYYWNKFLNMSKWTLDESEKQHLVPNLDPYNNRMFMPLAEFMKQPIARELLHNGELMQVGAAAVRMVVCTYVRCCVGVCVCACMCVHRLWRISACVHLGGLSPHLNTCLLAQHPLSLLLSLPTGAGPDQL